MLMVDPEVSHAPSLWIAVLLGDDVGAVASAQAEAAKLRAQRASRT